MIRGRSTGGDGAPGTDMEVLLARARWCAWGDDLTVMRWWFSNGSPDVSGSSCDLVQPYERDFAEGSSGAVLSIRR